MTKDQPQSVRAPASELDPIKEIRPQSPGSDSRGTSSRQQPASVMALASAANVAAQRGSGRKPVPPGSHSHRRSQTIVAAGELEMEIIQKHKAVEELHSELESKNKALEESQEEAQLAARIGQTLLQRNQEMGAESESKAIELLNRAESAEQVVKVFEEKLSLAASHIRSLDIARTRATLEAEQLTQELEDTRTQVHGLKADVARANDEIQRVHASKMRLEEQLESAQSRIATLEMTKRKLEADLSTKKDRIEVLESVERYNVEHISRLEIENQSICHQQHVLAHRERQLRQENETLAAKLAMTVKSTREQPGRCQELEQAILHLHSEMEDLREALSVEQARVAELAHINQEMEASVEHQRRVREDANEQEEEESTTRMLRNGSLFFELSRQIRQEMQDAKAQRAQRNSAAKKNSMSPEDHTHITVTASELESPCRSSTRTSRNPSSNNTDSLNETDELTDATTTVPTRASRLPSLQLERRRSQQEDAEIVRAAIAASKSPRSVGEQQESQGNSDDDDDILLKEFFVLTAAAVKIAGGGLRNDACNIHNEDLYAEAMAQNITFDQFHKWLERRLEDELETHLSPPKLASIVKPRTGTTCDPPPASARRKGITGFWSR